MKPPTGAGSVPQEQGLRRRSVMVAGGIAGAVGFGSWSRTAFAQAAAAGTLPSLESFFQNPAFGAVHMSPDGKAVALGVAARSGRVQLVVIELDQMTPKVVAGFNDGDVGEFEWVNNERLVFSIADYQLAVGDMVFGPGLYAVGRDGSDMRQLVSRNYSQVTEVSGLLNREPTTMPAYTYLAGVTRLRNSDDVFVYQPIGDSLGSMDYSRLYRLNTRTGRSVELKAPGKVVGWIMGADDVPRITLTLDKARMSVHYLAPGSQEWRKIDESDAYDGQGMQPLAFAPDGSLFVTARAGADTSSLYRYDLAAGALAKEPLLSLKGYDFTGGLITDDNRVLGIRYVTDAAATAWIDPELKKIQQKVDALLPGTINQITSAALSKSPNVVVRAYSDVDPGALLLFNAKTEKMTVLGPRMRDVDARQMGRKDMVRYKAADGLEIPAYLTLPKGRNKNLPLVVLVHGGPFVRGGDWRWSGEAQFLASRGYAVLEPESRGSTGFGFNHFKAGWRQWGLKMQTDIADGTRWAIAQGIADPKRICIAGASYGGYATLMGLINDPDLYRCGINWVGVTDLEMLYTVDWSDTSDAYKRFGMPRLVGDRVKDAEQFKSTSPLHNAHKITQPLLLAYGRADRRVPLVHGTRFRDAVQKTNKDVEWVEYPEEGHGWALVKNRIDFWTRVEKFLARNLAKA